MGKISLIGDGSSIQLKQKGGANTGLGTPNNQTETDRLYHPASNYLNRRAAQHKRVQKVYCGTEGMVSP